jgi:hypothetical protein
MYLDMRIKDKEMQRACKIVRDVLLDGVSIFDKPIIAASEEEGWVEVITERPTLFRPKTVTRLCGRVEILFEPGTFGEDTPPQYGAERVNFRAYSTLYGVQVVVPQQLGVIASVS